MSDAPQANAHALVPGLQGGPAGSTAQLPGELPFVEFLDLFPHPIWRADREGLGPRAALPHRGTLMAPDASKGSIAATELPSLLPSRPEPRWTSPRRCRNPLLT